jgi:hypothetical protein
LLAISTTTAARTNHPIAFDICKHHMLSESSGSARDSLALTLPLIGTVLRKRSRA